MRTIRNVNITVSSRLYSYTVQRDRRMTCSCTPVCTWYY